MEERGVGEWNVGKGKKSSNAALSSVRSCCTDYWPGLGTFATLPVTIELLAVPRGLDHGMCVCACACMHKPVCAFEGCTRLLAHK